MKRLLPWFLVTVLLAVTFHILTVKAYPYYVMFKLKMSRKGKMNTIVHAPRVSAHSRRVVRPSPDLLYSACGYDLSEKPLHVTAIIPEDTYWSVSMFAANTDNFFVINDRKLGLKKVDIILVKKGDKFMTNENTMVIESPSTKGVVLFRMLITDENKVDSLITVQRKASCRPLD